MSLKHSIGYVENFGSELSDETGMGRVMATVGNL
jgi:hypothetical protein